MDHAAKELADKVLTLSLNDQIVVAQRIWDNIEHFADPDVEKAWMQEAERRWQEIEEGATTCVPPDEAMKRARAALNRES